MATVKLYGNLREIAGIAAAEVPGDEVGEVINQLVREYPALQDVLYEQESLRPFVRVVINGRDIELAQGLQTEVAESSTVAIFPPLAGGNLEGKTDSCPY